MFSNCTNTKNELSIYKNFPIVRFIPLRQQSLIHSAPSIFHALNFYLNYSRRNKITRNFFLFLIKLFLHPETFSTETFFCFS